jgi:hypothetical protein
MGVRTGAEKVIICDKELVVAGLARELAACNEYADRIVVITRPGQDLSLDSDLERQVDLLL